MALYARSDLMSVGVSVEGHKGCGRTHSRPVDHGAPAKIWKLECPPCEDHLRSDRNWSTTLSEIPETHDEKITREDLEKRGARNQQQMTALALAKIAGIPGAADALGMSMNAGGAACPQGHQVTPGTKFCPECGTQVAAEQEVRRFPCGHANPVASRFCSECGGPATVEEPSNGGGGDAPPVAVEPGPVTAATVGALPSNNKMRGMKREDLAALATDAGISTEGTRADLLDRLIAANNAGNANGGV